MNVRVPSKPILCPHPHLIRLDFNDQEELQVAIQRRCVLCTHKVTKLPGRLARNMQLLNKRSMSLGILAGAMAGLACAASAQEVTLKLHHLLPPVAHAHKNMLAPWAERVGKASNGRIKVEIYPSMQLGGRPQQLADQARGMPCGARGELFAFKQHDVFPAQLGQVIGDGTADDTATDDDGAGVSGKMRHGADFPGRPGLAGRVPGPGKSWNG